MAGRSDIIKTNLKNKSTGQQSFITAFLAFGGTLSRVFTSYVETDSMQMLVASIVSFVLATIIILQFALYWNNKTPGDSSQPSTPGQTPAKPTSGRRSMKKVE